MNIQQALEKIINMENLSSIEMQSVMSDIMQGETTPAQIGGFLIALRMKGETIEEIAAAAMVMREFSLKVEIEGDHLVDIVGTGGDGMHTFNISTTSAFVIAAAGGKVAKHNNRSVSSRSGSADVLEKAGVKLGLPPEQVAACVNKIGVGFMFAPAHHSATKYAVGPRKELAVRTIFNMLGPLTNPAQVPNLLIGVYSKDLVAPVASVMNILGNQHVMVVHSDDGMDEISIAAPTSVAELKDGKIIQYQITPEQFGLDRGINKDIIVQTIEDSYAIMQSVLNNEAGAARDIVILNAGAAIYTSNLTTTLEDGIKLADNALNDGSAMKKLEELIVLSNSFDDTAEEA
ncbi:MAG: anthranilate phosphoribosyltransferase [Gammaproteobacteria bacterium]|jgi:anthranilate phosphoribosyltransferase